MIKTLRVEGLNGKLNFDLTFHEDFNVITGRNGSGKTTVLKLLWYAISGNCEHIFREMTLEFAELVTDTFTLQIRRVPRADEKSPTVEWRLQPEGGKIESQTRELATSERTLNHFNRRIVALSRSSLFFPTFRRIEGGFLMSRRGAPTDEDRYYLSGGSVENALAAVSHRLTVERHRFISSISTHDIVTNLTQQYANISEQVNEDHRALSREIQQAISEYGVVPSESRETAIQLNKANGILERIRSLAATHSTKQDSLLRPFTALSDLIARIFRHKGIQVTSRITLGETAEAIDSTFLSAGEKQMLSFLAYNAFEQDSVIFIDEPEISLHVDWQRTLFPTLFSQGTRNQFIVATHSPFIYTKYGDKELLLDQSRGD